MRLLDEINVADIATGAAVLGTGGGGNPYIGTLVAREAIRKYGRPTLVSLDELDDDALVVPAAGMGSPTVSNEKLPNGEDIIIAFQKLEQYLGKKIDATMSIEIGGGNSTTPIYVAARLGIPIVDCDGMGRAYPELQMVTHSIYGISATPMVMCDERGNTVIFDTIDNKWTETFARSITVNMGGRGMIALYAATVRQLKEAAVLNTITLAEKIGKTVRTARQLEANPVEAVRRAVDGYTIFTGKITDVQRRLITGFARGDVHIAGMNQHADKELVLNFQNEFLVAILNGTLVATTPDLIAVLDMETGEPITTEMLRYGMRVAVLAFPCDPKWRTPKGIDLVGPRYFGYDIDYIPVEEAYGDER
jgi:uncharacterized protein